MCSSEVPDVTHSVVPDYPGVVTWLVSTGEPVEGAFAFIQEADTSLPVVMDEDQSLYNLYANSQPGFGLLPLQVLIDEDGVIRYLSRRYDAVALRDALDQVTAD